MSIEQLMRDRLAVLAPQSLRIIDDSAAHAGHAGAGGGGHYRLHIVSPQFAGQRSLQRHRLVHDALGDLLKTQIHALSLTTATPDEIAQA